MTSDNDYLSELTSYTLVTSDNHHISELISYTSHAAPLGCCIRGTFPKRCICVLPACSPVPFGELSGTSKRRPSAN